MQWSHSLYVNSGHQSWLKDSSCSLEWCQKFILKSISFFKLVMIYTYYVYYLSYFSVNYYTHSTVLYILYCTQSTVRYCHITSYHHHHHDHKSASSRLLPWDQMVLHLLSLSSTPLGCWPDQRFPRCSCWADPHVWYLDALLTLPLFSDCQPEICLSDKLLIAVKTVSSKLQSPLVKGFRQFLKVLIDFL